MFHKIVFFQVKIAPSEFIHLRVYQDLKANIHLHGLQHGKEEEDELEYFEKNI